MVHKDGKNSRPYVFTIHSQQLSSHPVQTLDVAADSLEDLTCWVSKIREATQNADARVSSTTVMQTKAWEYCSRGKHYSNTIKNDVKNFKLNSNKKFQTNAKTF